MRSLFPLLLAAFILVVSVYGASSKKPSKVLTKGFAERITFAGPCDLKHDAAITTITSFPLGECIPVEVGHNSKINYSKFKIQTYKNTKYGEVLVQGYSDSSCRKKVGQQKVFDEYRDEKCVYDEMRGTFYLDRYALEQTNPEAAGGNVDAYTFKNNANCDETHSAPLRKYYKSNWCVPDSVSGHDDASSMVMDCMNGYALEYTSPDCTGNATYVNIGGVLGTCGREGKAAFKRYCTAPSTVWDFPVGESFSGSMSTGIYDYHTVFVPASTNGGSVGGTFTLTSTNGDFDMYLTIDGSWPSTTNAFYFSASTLEVDTMTVYFNCPPEGCYLRVAVYAHMSMGGSYTLMFGDRF